MADKSKKKQRATSQKASAAPDDERAQQASANGKAKGKGKKKKQRSASGNGVLALADHLPNGRLSSVMTAALGYPDANVQWPVLLLRQGLMLVVEGIDARYGLAQQRSESHARQT